MSTNDPEELDLLAEASGAVLRAEAGRLHLNQSALIRAGLSKGTAGNYWHGRREPRLKDLVVIVRVLGLTVGEFWELLEAEQERLNHEHESILPDHVRLMGEHDQLIDRALDQA